jgi:hypothetical protein
MNNSLTKLITVSVGFALSIPFILLAFNLDRVSGWLSSMLTIIAPHKKSLWLIGLCLGTLVIILVVFWTSPEKRVSKIFLPDSKRTIQRMR